jgi:ubiquinone/menaquinone biosynthesis C-methylase UbiE
MKPAVLDLLCDPITHESLELKTKVDGQGQPQESLINPKTGRRYPIRNGIPIFFLEGEVIDANQRYQSMYDRLAPFYDFSTSVYSFFKGMSVEKRLREYLDELEVKENDRVLEVSVGTGRNWQFLPHTARFYGLDISLGMLRQCQRNVKKWKLESSLFAGTAEHLPFRDEAFDVVFHFGGINFFNDKAAAINEMIRVAKPGTKFIIGDENEALAKKYENLPVTGGFYGNRKNTITAPIDLLPAGMQEIKIKDITGGDLYCLSFRKPK